MLYVSRILFIPHVFDSPTQHLILDSTSVKYSFAITFITTANANFLSKTQFKFLHTVFFQIKFFLLLLISIFSLTIILIL